MGGLVALLRDKPKLEASQQVEVLEAGKNSTARLVLHIVSNGRRPLTLFTAGFTGRWERQGRWPRRRSVPVSRNIEAIGEELPKRLDPGDIVTFSLDLVGPTRIYKPDATPQGFAMDT